ncbi:putative bifunctional diguanylate cyclase/phosphodiesterase [Kineococcus sp. SYSU DK005]|uniref:putative bifunctional diguanylate cyclase/phosphodiesterase n=1 Tax=Kineococcus sp. SYSU DK005 TaxID=3383126 RepID=UPI003D7D9CA5
MRDPRSGAAGRDVPAAARSATALAALCVLLYPLPLPDAVRTGLMAAVALLSVTCLVVGVRLHRPRPLSPWLLMPCLAVLFLPGNALRPWSTSQDGFGRYVPDVFTLSAYLLLAAALARLARAHGGLRREVVCDVGVVAAAGALAAARFLVLPTTQVPGRSTAESVLAGAYPLVDVLLLTLGVDLVLSGPRRRSHHLLVAALAALLVGDLLYAAYGVRGVLVPPDVVNTPFLAAYVLVALAALHPSQAPGPPPPAAAAAAAAPLDAWSLRRLPLLVAALAAVTVVVAVPPADEGPLLRLATGLALGVVLALLLVRAVSAVDGQARARAVLQHRAGHDALTGLPNRQEVERVLGERLAARRAPGTADWLLYVDLDGFKRVNDTWGHACGDQLLRAVAGRLRAVLPPPAVVGRLSGDEFVVLATTAAGAVEDLARRVLAVVEEPVRLDVAEVVVTGSVGVAEVRGSADQTLRDADTAMYRAKRRGRAQWAVFDESMRTALGNEMELELDLRRALERDAFELVYQAVVDLPTGVPVGVEALLRWHRPASGPVPPAVFVPVLEASGLIVPVGARVLRTAVRQLARWHREGLVGPSFGMSVNVSPHQLLHPSFPGAVEEALREEGVDGALLTLEITESSMLAEDAGTTAVLEHLRRLGVGLAVDDFGTGYSALSYLRALPVTAVKVDRSFVSALHDPHGPTGDEAVVRAVVAVGRALGLRVTAEGVETAGQARVLRALGVELGQGWLWHRAGAAHEVARLLGAAPAAPPAPGAGDPRLNPAGEG